jgi:hypothetical protein
MRRKHVTRLHNGEEDTSSDDNTTMDHEEEAFAAIQTEKPVSILTNIPHRNTVSADSCNDINLTYRNMG